MSFTCKEYDELLQHLKEVECLSEVMGLLSWDQETMMPQGSLEARALQRSALAGLLHERFTAPHLGDLAREAHLKHQQSDKRDPYVAANLREFLRSYERETKVPRTLVEALSKAEAESHHAWVNARETNQIKDFLPHLETLLRLRLEESRAIDPHRPPYDVQLEKYEVGLKSHFITSLFQVLKSGLPPLIQRISRSAEKPKRIQGTFPVASQKRLGIEVAGLFGFDFNRGRMDISVHPFCGGVGPTDVRFTTRYREDEFIGSLAAVIHETGHALYEQGRDLARRYEPVSTARSMGVHESQSLLWEKHVGLSHHFWRFLYPKAQKIFSPYLDAASLDDFYFAIHEVKPSFIRVDADEVTYPLHVVLRFELEEMLFANKTCVAELPDLWKKNMQEYLGITPPTDREGVLQDVHWAYGLFGYFPAYNLGAIYASQLFAAVEREHPDLQEYFAKGEFTVLREWLRRKIHQPGSLYETDQLMREATGETINAQIHLDRLTRKYTQIYNV